MRLSSHVVVGPVMVSADESERAVTDFGFRLVNVEVGSWEDLDVKVTQLADRVGQVDLPVTRTVAIDMIPVIETWLATPEKVHMVPFLVARLLESTEVAADSELRCRLLGFQTDALAG